MKNKINLSAFLVVRNEEKNIARALKSLWFCDEIIIIDQQSTDKTLAIAKKYTNKIYEDKQWGYCEPSRILGAKKCTGKWILNIDADEEVSPQLAKDIQKAIKSDDMDGYEIHREFVYLGTVMTNLCRKEFILRLHKKGIVKYTSEIHNGVILQKGSKIGRINASINHYWLTGVHDHKIKIMKYAKIQAKTNKKYNRFPGKYFGILFRPIGIFIYYYFYKKLFLDGKAGLIYSFMGLYHELLVFKYVWFNSKD